MKPDSHLKEVVFKGLQGLLVKLVSILSGLGVSVLISHELGAEGLGLYALMDVIVLFAVVLAKFGMDNAIIKLTAAYEDNKNHIMMNAVIRDGLLVVFFSSTVIALCLFFSKNYIVFFFQNNSLGFIFEKVFVVIVPVSVMMLIASFFKGQKKTWLGVLSEEGGLNIIRFILLLGWGFTFGEFYLEDVVNMYIISAFIMMVVVAYIWKKSEISKGGIRKRYGSIKLLKDSFPLYLVVLLAWLNGSIDTVMLGILSSAEEVGYYVVATKISLAISLVLIVFNSIIAPKFSQLFSSGNLDELKRLYQSSLKLLTFISAIILICIFYMVEIILKIWGEEFLIAENVVKIISIAQFINVACGSVGMLLIMTGNQRFVSIALIVAVVINFILNLFLIPVYGAVGAAVATGSALIIMNLIQIYGVKKTLGFGLSSSVYQETKC